MVQANVRVSAERLLLKDEGPFVKRQFHGNVSAGRAVHIRDGGIMQSTGDRWDDLVGVALEDGKAGEERFLQFHGWVNPRVVNLGAGIACAVGVSADGHLVRATDPACTSAPHWIGKCDVNGEVFIAAVDVSHMAFNIMDFGADPTGVTDSGAAIQSAIDHAPDGSVIFLPVGRFKHSAPIYMTQYGDMPYALRRHAITLQGSGSVALGSTFVTGTVLEYTGATGDGVRMAWDVDFNGPYWMAIRDIQFLLSNSSNVLGGAIAIAGGCQCVVERCNFSGAWNYGLIWDGAEECAVYDCYFNNEHTPTARNGSVGIWLVGGTRTVELGGAGFTGGDSTNVHKISGCYFNGPDIGIRMDQCASIDVVNCLCNLHDGSALATIGRAVNVRFQSCYTEGFGADCAHYKLGQPAYPGGTTADGVAIINHLASGNVPFIKGGNNPTDANAPYRTAAYNVRIEDCLMACDWIDDGGNLTGSLVFQNNVVSSSSITAKGKVFASDTHEGVPFVMNAGYPVNYKFGTVRNPNSNHEWGVRSYALPMHRDSAGGGQYVLRDDWVDSVSKTRRAAQSYSTLTGLPSRREDAFEYIFSYAANTTGVDQHIALLDIAERSMGIIEVEVTGTRAGDETDVAVWKITRPFVRANGGHVVLLDTDTVSFSRASGGYIVPTIYADGAADKVGVTIHPHSTDIAYWTASVKVQAVRP